MNTSRNRSLWTLCRPQIQVQVLSCTVLGCCSNNVSHSLLDSLTEKVFVTLLVKFLSRYSIKLTWMHCNGCQLTASIYRPPLPAHTPVPNPDEDTLKIFLLVFTYEDKADNTKQSQKPAQRGFHSVCAAETWAYRNGGNHLTALTSNPNTLLGWAQHSLNLNITLCSCLALC